MIYKFKNKEINPKDFRNCQNLIGLFKDLRDVNINPKEVLKDQMNFKSDLVELKKRKYNIRRSNECNTKCSKSFWCKRKNY